jgi:hypothetical protein
MQILIIPFAFALDLGITWFSYNVLFALINWFNKLSLFWKILLVFVEGFVILTLVTFIFKFVGSLLSLFIFGKLPDNLFTIIFSVVIFLVNAGFSVYFMWQVIPKFNFWTTIEFLFLIWFVVSVNTILIPWYIKEKVKRSKIRSLQY